MVSSYPSRIKNRSGTSLKRFYPDTLIAACVLCCVVSKFLAVFAALHAEVAGQAVAWRRFTQQRVGLVWFWTLVQAPAFAFSNLADCWYRWSSPVSPQVA